MLGGGGVLSALWAGMLEKERRAKGERRCWLIEAVRRRAMMGVLEMSGDCIRGGGEYGGLLVLGVRAEEAVGLT